MFVDVSNVPFQGFWHMQMHPGTENQNWDVHKILETYRFIGLYGQPENWKNKRASAFIRNFLSAMRVNDIVAIRKGNKLIALTQVIGGAYDIRKDRSFYTTEKESPLVDWITYRRPVKILDMMREEMKAGLKFPEWQETLTRCTEGTPSTQIVKEWFKKVQEALKAKGERIVLV
ncbi:hypothetical protein [Helicobacter cynogastricus]|uniref:hypothetical protein n=1 Tax=Helicobacter cynogastricus TaxID=329937 RepID=UPI000CF17C9B|nr:hypothetical protein [Helicobacter cynogastricus]